jgi:gliding motility-associated-like protein
VLWKEKLTVEFEAVQEPNVTYNWDFGDGRYGNGQLVKHQFPRQGNYQVKLTVTNPEGCEQVFEMTIDVRRKFFVYIPEAFTPNNDGINDVFTLSATGQDDFEMQIFNRWGEMVFQSQDPTQGWDGRLSDGSPAPSGVYVVRVMLILAGEVFQTEVQELTLYY